MRLEAPIYHLRRLVYQYRESEKQARMAGDTWTADGHAAAARLFEEEVARREGDRKPTLPADPFAGFRD